MWLRRRETLDEILGNTTDLVIDEHTVDTHGQTLATFALFDLCGYRLSPRIAKLTNRQLWRPNRAGHYTGWDHAGPLLQHHAQIDVLERHWDDSLRIAGSLREGTVSAALLIARAAACESSAGTAHCETSPTTGSEDWWC